VQDDLIDKWPLIQAELRRAVPEHAYRNYLAAVRPRELCDAVLVVGAPERTHRWIAERFARVLQTCAAAVLGPEVEVEVVGPSSGKRAAPEREAPVGRAQPLNPTYTFDEFVIGTGNRLAHAAALAVAELPGQAYNPLFIYGEPGLGKTHLLQAIASYLATYSPSVTARCATVEQFATHFVSALHSGVVDKFKHAYRGVDVLLIDDVQFLERKAKTEEEFFHTFNALYDAGSQLVFTSDSPPRDMDALEERLRARFESGLLADIQAPDYTTRLTILRKRARAGDVALADHQVLELIADRVRDNIRSLEGALTRIVAYQSLVDRDRPITLEIATSVLDRLYPQPARAQRSVRDIQLATCRAFSLSLDELLSHDRSARVAWPRQMAMHLVRELTDLTLPAIGRDFGGRDHTTVLHADRRARQRLARDAQAQHALNRVHEELKQART
jgi:chromosomal replication initiator protein